MDALIAAAIHEAKNGLTALTTWLTEAQREHPSHALTEAQAVATRVNAQMVELLALYREAEGSLRLAIDDHDLTDFCEDLGTGRTLFPQSAVRFETEPGAATDIGAWAFDAYQVNLVLLDALRNAGRFARSVVRLNVEKTADGICFTVVDDGPGFPAEILDGAASAMNSTSSGLGLRFARLIAQRHATPDGRHGRIELENNGGAVFRLFLP